MCRCSMIYTSLLCDNSSKARTLYCTQMTCSTSLLGQTFLWVFVGPPVQVAPYLGYAEHLKKWDCKAALKECHDSASGVRFLSSLLKNSPSSKPSAGERLSDVWFTEFVTRLHLPSTSGLFEPLDLRALVGNNGKAKHSNTHCKSYPMCSIVSHLGEILSILSVETCLAGTGQISSGRILPLCSYRPQKHKRRGTARASQTMSP